METTQTQQNKEPRMFVQSKAKVSKPKTKNDFKLSWKVKVPAVTITVLLAVFGTAYGIDSFFDSYDLRFQTPIIIQTPVKIESRTPMVSPMASPEATPSATTTPEPEVEETSLQIVKPALAKETARVLVGEASFYSTKGCMGCDPEQIMANGVKLDDSQLTVALPPHIVTEYKLLNDMVRIKNTSNGKEVIAQVTDTGGFYKLTNGRRVADLTIATRDALGCKDLCQVEVNY